VAAKRVKGEGVESYIIIQFYKYCIAEGYSASVSPGGNTKQNVYHDKRAAVKALLKLQEKAADHMRYSLATIDHDLDAPQGALWDI
jgi:hypothetical protein